MSVPWDLMGGVNLYVDPLKLKDNESCAIKNLYPFNDRKIETRKGTQFLWRCETSNDQTLNIPTNFYVPKFRPDIFATVAFDTVTGIQYLTVGTFGTVAWGLEATLPILINGYRPKFMEYGRRLLLLAGACDNQGRSIWEIVDEGGTPAVRPAEVYFHDGNGNFLAPRVCCNFRGRMVYANFGLGYEDVVVFADGNDRPYKINAAGADQSLNISVAGGRSLKFTQMAGDAITAMTETERHPEGSPADACLAVFGAHTAIMSGGVPLLTDDVPPTGQGYLGTLNPVRINAKCGCVSAETLVKTAHGLIWASWNDVWVMDIGSEPRAVGTKIRPALQVGSTESRFMWHAVYHHESASYRLAVVGEGQDASVQNGIPNACQDQWWLDVGSGLPQNADEASWFGPHQYRILEEVSVAPAHPGTFMMRVELREQAPERILGVHLMHESALFASTRVPCIIEFDKMVGWDLALPLSATTDHSGSRGTLGIEVWPDEMVGNQIEFEILSKEYDFGDAFVDKLFQGMEMQVWSSDLINITCETIVDGGRVVSQSDVNLEQLGFVAGVDGGGSRLTHQYQSIVVLPSESERLCGKVFQFRLFNAAGWPVPENGLDSSILCGPEVGDIQTIALTPEFYTTRALFLAELVRALNANGFMVGTFTSAADGTTGLLYVSVSGAVKWVWNYSGTTDAEVIRRSKKLGAMLGFNIEGLAAATRQDAVDLVPMLVSPGAELASLSIRVYAFEKRPSGGKYEPNVP